MHLKIFVDDCCGPEIERHLGADKVGREYLTNLRESATRTRERQTRARAVSFQMHRLFLPLDEDVTCRLTESGKMVLDIAHLIDRKCVERYQNKFATTSAALRECQMQVSGPWPPYHFVHRLTRPPTHPHPVSEVAVPVLRLAIRLSLRCRERRCWRRFSLGILRASSCGDEALCVWGAIGLNACAGGDARTTAGQETGATNCESPIRIGWGFLFAAMN